MGHVDHRTNNVYQDRYLSLFLEHVEAHRHGAVSTLLGGRPRVVMRPILHVTLVLHAQLIRMQLLQSEHRQLSINLGYSMLEAVDSLV